MQIGCPHHIIEHCQNVTKIALRIASVFNEKGYDVDLSLIEAGAMLHDIGRSKTHEIDHAAVGGRIIRELGIHESVAKIVDRHIGAGIPEDEALELGLPPGHYVPETLEEKIVCYADKLIAGRRVVDISVTIDEFAEKHGEDHPAIKRMHDLHDEINGMIGNVSFCKSLLM
jgi:uncharacterized protein